MPKGSDEIFVQNLLQAFPKHPKIKAANVRSGGKAITTLGAKFIKPIETPKKGPREKFIGFTIAHYADNVTYNSEGFLVLIFYYICLYYICLYYICLYYICLYYICLYLLYLYFLIIFFINRIKIQIVIKLILWLYLLQMLELL